MQVCLTAIKCLPGRLSARLATPKGADRHERLCYAACIQHMNAADLASMVPRAGAQQLAYERTCTRWPHAHSQARAAPDVRLQIGHLEDGGGAFSLQTDPLRLGRPCCTALVALQPPAAAMHGTANVTGADMTCSSVKGFCRAGRYVADAQERQS